MSLAPYAGTYEHESGAVDNLTTYSLTLCANGFYFWAKRYSVVSPTHAFSETKGHGQGHWTLQGGEILFNPPWMNSNSRLAFSPNMVRQGDSVYADRILLGPNVTLTRVRMAPGCDGAPPTPAVFFGSQVIYK